MSQNEKILLLRKILTDYLRQEKQSQEDLNKTLNQFAIKIQQQYRSKQQLDSSYKPKINTLREYYEKVLLLDHKKQWDDHEKSATIYEDSHLE